MSTDTNYIPNTIPGIDTLYYFYETNDIYDDLFLDIIDQLDEVKSRYEKHDIRYENKDIMILINKQAFVFNGKSQGFYWFNHLDSYMTIGFKDYMTNRGLNDIQVQLNAIGIYTLGLKSLLQYTDNLLANYITGHKPLTRVDLNIFVNSDLSWLTKDMFVARKRSYVSIFKEIANKHALQTLYIGKKPFLLRIYDKMAELQTSKKKDMMMEYFYMNGFRSFSNIFNIEFEMHRSYFKTFSIDTVDDLLQRAELLFQDCLESIRLVDLSSITDNTKDNKNKNRAKTHPLWEHLNSSYKLKDFLALEAPLEKIKRKGYRYTIEEAIQEQVTLARKAYVHNIVIDEQFYSEVLQTFKNTKEFLFPSKIKKDVLQLYEDATENINIHVLNNMDLQRYINRLEADIAFERDDIDYVIKQHQVASLELTSRKANANKVLQFRKNR